MAFHFCGRSGAALTAAKATCALAVTALAAAVGPTVPALAARTAAPADTMQVASAAVSPSDTVYVVPPIVVEGARVDPALDQPGFASVVDVRRRRNRVEDLPAVLSRLTGMRVRQYGGLGSFASVSIRGSSASQVDVFLDGVPLNDAYMGMTNIGDLPLDGIQRIEVYRGYAPPELGSTSIGGAVNLVTADDSKWNGALLSRIEGVASYGSFDTSRYAASVWSDLRAVKLFVNAGYVRSAGNFEFVDDQTTPYNPQDDETTVRQNNDFEAWNGLARLKTELGGAGALSLGYTALVREEGVPGVGSFQSQHARAERSRHVTSLSFDSERFIERRLRFSAGVYDARANEKFHDLEREISFLPQDTDNTFVNDGVSGRVEADVPFMPLRVELFHRSKDERFTPRQNAGAPSEGPDRKRESHRTILSGDFFVDPLRLVLTGDLRWEREITEFYDPPAFSWLPPSPQGKVERESRTPHVGFRWQLMSFLTAKGNWGRYVRPPTMLELFGDTGSVTGRADLEPEEGLNRDVGLVMAFAKVPLARSVRAEVVYVDNKVENLILFFPNSQYTTRPQNIGSARIRGWELSLAALALERVRMTVNYTHLESTDTGPIPYYNGNALPGRPTTEAAFLADYLAGRWKLSYELQYIGENFLDPANRKLVPAREIHNLALQLKLVPSVVSLTAEVKNLTDNRISDVNGYPLPGRSFFATLTYQP